ncbi:uncharacterized protein LOC62_04G006056 [Vanrija pseudolonga]|uniref:Uncharacterized protein n=1 Tax=Vanrija pseudolonga TaxID=143232 RepID=A0AAF1BRS7_9TREE|nr:hypothetical protein LOC62_04G006056 [Vanrija pseudolonga]
MSKTVNGVAAPLRSGLTYGTAAPSTFHLIAYRHVHGSSWFAGFVQHPSLLRDAAPRWDSTRREWIHSVWAFVVPDGAPFSASLEALERADGDVVAVTQAEWTRLSQREEYVFWPAYRFKLQRGSDPASALAYAHRVVRHTPDEVVWRAVEHGQGVHPAEWAGFEARTEDAPPPPPPIVVVSAATPTRAEARRGWRMVA